MSRRKNPWRGINKCIMCGTQLRFEASTAPGADPMDGRKVCDQNHASFIITGFYAGVDGIFWLEFFMPQKEGRQVQ